MSEGENAEGLSEYDRLTREYAKIAGPLESLGQHIQDGLELEVFRETKAGKILIGSAMLGMMKALGVILDPNYKTEAVMISVYELRVQYRVLETISSVINTGHNAHRQVLLEDQESKDEHTESA